MELTGRHVTVVGLGNSGLNAATLAQSMGAYVWATDSRDVPETRRAAGICQEKGMRVEVGRHTQEFVKESQLVVISPGVEDSAPPVKWAMELDIPIISEMEFGFRSCRGKVIAVTGTNGKSTVTTLIGEIMRKASLDVVVCGNIGNSLCGEVSRIRETTWVVLEVSSFQLEKIETFRPAIALILNITDDHLDRYATFDDYFREKLKIFSNQGKDDVLILNHDAQNLREIKKKARANVLFYSKYARVNGAYTKNGRIICLSNREAIEIGPVSEIPLKGLHNVENVLASSLVGVLVGVGAASIRSAIKGFKGLPHRVEPVDVIDGVEYVDDSKGTTVDSTYRALESSAKPVILIAGGRDKNSNYGLIRDLARKKVRHLILIGEAKEKIRAALGDTVKTHEAQTMLDAVRLAHGLAEKGSTVLLSPMCSSFDMFRDYKERGDLFKEAVRSIKEDRTKRAHNAVR